jgi:hypothetical protein
VFWVISVYFNIRNTLPKSGTFLLGNPVYNIDINSIPNGIVTPPIPLYSTLSFRSGIKEIWGKKIIQPRQRLQPKGLGDNCTIKK